MRTPLFSPGFDIGNDVRERAAQVKLALFDVDGVLTGGHVILGQQDEYKCFDIKDGHGLRMLARHGIEVGIITGRSSRAVERRAEELGIRHVYQGCKEKLPFYRELVAKLGLAPAQTSYMGDDWMDLPVMLQAGLSAAVADAHPLVKRHAHWTAPSPGGCGAARELAELLIFAQGAYDDEIARYIPAGPAS
ncbi:MAG TPA: HAD-IIIA family hydrolase [Burkholderiales bacterium]|nr:HAD-IIIA family hydrolase [Burkholderiales bacterium]